MFKSLKKSKKYNAAIILESGDVFYGEGIGIKGMKLGELCFNTAMTGYQEAITDPSYAAQILLFTFPHIGITGTNKTDVESSEIYLSGVVFKSLSLDYSNWRGLNNINDWLTKNKVVGINKINTRDLTIKIREKGALKGAIVNGIDKSFKTEKVIKKIRDWDGIEKQDLASDVSCKKPNLINNTNKKIRSIDIVALDFGCKKNILDLLAQEGFKTTVLPYEVDFDKIMQHKPQGIFLSNGPGDPFATYAKVSETLKKLIKINIPLFGICLGHQLLGLSLNARTKKMHHGHHGVNQPVKNLSNNTIEITSQNHGFVIDKKTLPSSLKITHISLFDGVIQGLQHKSKNIFSVQYHPEASPGPHDSKYLFKKYRKLILNSRKNAKKKRY